MFYLELFKKFQDEQIKYFVVGGLAVNLNGYSRFTADIDICIELQSENIKKIIKIILDFGFKNKFPVNPMDFADEIIRKDWIDNKNMLAFNFYNPKNIIEEIDIVIISPDEFLRIYNNRLEHKIKDILISTISIDDLIEMKKKAGRKIDEIDIEQLMKIKELEKNE